MVRKLFKDLTWICLCWNNKSGFQILLQFLINLLIFNQVPRQFFFATKPAHWQRTSRPWLTSGWTITSERSTPGPRPRPRSPSTSELPPGRTSPESPSSVTTPNSFTTEKAKNRNPERKEFSAVRFPGLRSMGPCSESSRLWKETAPRSERCIRKFAKFHSAL